MGFGIPQSDEQQDNAGKRFGKYFAFVRDNNDPERLGRCRLEIPAVFGEGEGNLSEWAWPCFPYGGNDDSGMFLVPEVGASVWAEFVGGDIRVPIWAGCWLAGSNPGEQPIESMRLCSEITCEDCEDACLRATNRQDNIEHRKFHNHPDYYCPRRKVLLKTETGHTIVADDRDGQEFFRVIDRAGQIIEMLSPVLPSVQKGNVKRRGTRTATQGDQLSLDDLLPSGAKIEIMDLSRQSLLFEAVQDHEKVTLRSCNAARTRWQRIILDTTSGAEQVRIQGLNGAQEIVIDSTGGAERITITDANGNTVTMTGSGITLTDGSGGVIAMHGGIDITAAGVVNITGTTVNING